MEQTAFPRQLAGFLHNPCLDEGTRSNHLILQGRAIKESGVKTVPLEREIISISPLLLVSPSQGSIYTHTAAQQALPLFLFPAKASPRASKPLPCKPCSRILAESRSGTSAWCRDLFHTYLLPGIWWHWDDQLVCMSSRI